MCREKRWRWLFENAAPGACIVWRRNRGRGKKLEVGFASRLLSVPGHSLGQFGCGLCRLAEDVVYGGTQRLAGEWLLKEE